MSRRVWWPWVVLHGLLVILPLVVWQGTRWFLDPDAHGGIFSDRSAADLYYFLAMVLAIALVGLVGLGLGARHVLTLHDPRPTLPVALTVVPPLLPILGILVFVGGVRPAEPTLLTVVGAIALAVATAAFPRLALAWTITWLLVFVAAGVWTIRSGGGGAFSLWALLPLSPAAQSYLAWRHQSRRPTSPAH